MSDFWSISTDLSIFTISERENLYGFFFFVFLITNSVFPSFGSAPPFMLNPPFPSAESNVPFSFACKKAEADPANCSFKLKT